VILIGNINVKTFKICIRENMTLTGETIGNR
jgi:hypothetical protein